MTDTLLPSLVTASDVATPDVAISAVAAPHVRDQDNWHRCYSRRLLLTDVFVLGWALLGAVLLNHLLLARPAGPRWIEGSGLTYAGVAGLVIVVWMAALAALGSRHYRVLGAGVSEFKAVLVSGMTVLVVLALIGLAFQVDFSRGFVLVALLAGLLGLLVSRAMWRSWLRLQRAHGRFSSRVLVVGSVETADQVATELARHTEAGYHVVGASTTSPTSARTLPTGVPIVGTVATLLDAVRSCRADTVVVTDGHNLPCGQLRELSWNLEPGRHNLVISPSMTDVAGPRIHARPVAGLPLMHVETPRYEGADRFLKRAFDVTGALVLLGIGALPLLLVAVLVLTTSPGGLLFGHERIGRRGRPFRMLKFRSMVSGADAQLADLLAQQGTSDRPLFKVTDDPRITRVGAFLRRYSIDEVPQLINVLRGDMSLVGPRPQVAAEVALYDFAASRRLFVKPGMTGLWQVSGRSNLSWEEAVRLDLSYVENWSMTADLSILLRTVKAVVGSSGAV